MYYYYVIFNNFVNYILLHIIWCFSVTRVGVRSSSEASHESRLDVSIPFHTAGELAAHAPTWLEEKKDTNELSNERIVERMNRTRHPTSPPNSHSYTGTCAFNEQSIRCGKERQVPWSNRIVSEEYNISLTNTIVVPLAKSCRLFLATSNESICIPGVCADRIEPSRTANETSQDRRRRMNELSITPN